MKTGIIIPCYNEEKRLNVTAFKKFISKENDYHLCFVNDGSKDNTLKVLQEIKEVNPAKVSIVDMKKNGGKAAAVRAGSRYLYSFVEIDYIGFIDADLSTDFEDFGDLLKTLKTNNELNFVFGSRAKNASEAIEKDKIRSLLSKVINILIVLIVGLSIDDTQCGAKVYKAELVPIVFAESFMSKWLFDVEMFIRMKKYFGKEQTARSIFEQPLKKWVHMDDSKIGLKDSLEIPYKLFSIWLNYNVLPTMSTNEDVMISEPVVEIYNNSAPAMVA
ncbi:glycosyltransferase family 2 protein [Aquimarina sp. MMG015]|uniref:dolichyl-phosphate beta-glucosyltransferase n=1 Tax=Aquimarina TaxID=290174 RepID=UPI00041D8BDF|nr:MULTISPECIES: dolichyl-phosphate beta-glucosyltransferase [Aquimarina]AXT56777.1 glycosyltransferase family 2 protein [Aquimarina sp. AD1]MBQ4802776.1 glycosyltransferase family 2 protein [Aquimarina sp. MMG015]RKN24995.1 glycosyltransferase family 2 protein [Aquimarina sp. AD1]